MASNALAFTSAYFFDFAVIFSSSIAISYSLCRALLSGKSEKMMQAKHRVNIRRLKWIETSYHHHHHHGKFIINWLDYTCSILSLALDQSRPISHRPIRLLNSRCFACIVPFSVDDLSHFHYISATSSHTLSIDPITLQFLVRSHIFNKTRKKNRLFLGVEIRIRTVSFTLCCNFPTVWKYSEEMWSWHHCPVTLSICKRWKCADTTNDHRRLIVSDQSSVCLDPNVRIHYAMTANDIS